jgi:Holliday junction resolvase-like predicted endonuclease
MHSNLGTSKDIGNLGEKIALQYISSNIFIEKLITNFKNKHCEIDLLILTNRKTFIIEVKAGFSSFSTLRQRINTSKIYRLINCFFNIKTTQIEYIGIFIKFNKNLTNGKIKVMRLTIF